MGAGPRNGIRGSIGIRRIVATGAALAATISVVDGSLAPGGSASSATAPGAAPRIARVAESWGDVLIARRSADGSPAVEDPAYPAANVYPGDAVRTGTGGWVRLQVPGDLTINVEEESELIMAYRMSDRSSRPDDWLHYLTRGTVQVSRRTALPFPFRVVTVAASVHLTGAGEIRITAGRDSRATVDVRRGAAEVVSAGGSVVVDNGLSTTVVHGRRPGEPEAMTEDARDRFGRWDRQVLLDRRRLPRARPRR